MAEWRFPSNLNGDINGINDSGIETFADDSYYSLVRETIQNSLDVHNPNSAEPVIVEFKEFSIPRESLPGIESLTDAIHNCLESNIDEKDAKRFFENAETAIKKEELSVLKVSDYNTRGLEGSDTCGKGTAWSRLIKENGSSNKEDTSGGSKGIGKNATYACSSIRTVLYSSLDIYGLKSSFGVAKLISFKLPENTYSQGKGYFSEDETFTAIHDTLNLDAVERTEPGTDIYIICNSPDTSLHNKIKQSVLLDFFISIYEEKLIVKIQDEVISKETLDKYISQINDLDEDKKSSLLTYYHVLTGNDPEIIKINLNSEDYGKEYGFEDNDCILWLYAGKENLNRRVLMTREAGMRLFEQDHISGSINFTGILQITGKKMNKVFKEMEVPSHDAWKPKRNNNPGFYEDIYGGLRDYIRAKVKEKFGVSSVNSIDAFGVEDFLPDSENIDNGKELEGKHLTPNTKLGEQKRMKPSKKRTTIKEQISFDEKTDTYGNGGGGQNPGKDSPNTENPISNPGTQSGPDPTESPIAKEDGKNTKDSYKQVETNGSRLMCIDAEKGIYRYSFTVPNNAKKGKLEFYLSGEQSEFPLSIISAKDLSDKDSFITCDKDGKIIMEDIKKGSRHQLEIQVNFDACCMMEVSYYESKK